MAISYVAFASDGNVAVSETVSDPAGTQENDFYIAICSKQDDTNSGTWATPAGWTKLTEEYTSTGGSNDQVIGIFYRFRGASAVGATTFEHSAASSNIHVLIAAYRGVDTTTPFDVTYSSGSHYAHATDTTTGGTPAAITTATNGALVALLGSTGGTTTSHGAPSGYALDATDVNGFMRAACVASKTVATAGTETPGAWTHTLSASSESNSITVALKPASTVTLFPDMEPLYYGTSTLLANKTGIEFRVADGHTGLNGELIDSGVNGTTNASGVFQFPGSGYAGAASDPVTVSLYWEEGSSPVVDRSLIVKTTLVEV